MTDVLLRDVKRTSTRPRVILLALHLGSKRCVELAQLFGVAPCQLGGTLSAMQTKGLIEKQERGRYMLTNPGRTEAEKLVETHPELLPQAGRAQEEPGRRERTKKPLHWAVRDLFAEAETQKLKDNDLEEAILKATGQRIPANTLRYWRNGWSDPKITEVDMIAKALGYELDLMKT